MRCFLRASFGASATTGGLGRDAPKPFKDKRLNWTEIIQWRHQKQKGMKRMLKREAPRWSWPSLAHSYLHAILFELSNSFIGVTPMFQYCVLSSLFIWQMIVHCIIILTFIGFTVSFVVGKKSEINRSEKINSEVFQSILLLIQLSEWGKEQARCLSIAMILYFLCLPYNDRKLLLASTW